MSNTLRRVVPIAMLCVAVVLAGCVVVPERRVHGPAVYTPGHVHAGWGWRH